MFHIGNLGDGTLIAEFGFYYLLSEVSNYLFCILIVCIFIKLNLIQRKYLFFWLLYFLSPFLFNFILFSPSYMPDQFHYHEIVSSIKGGDYDLPEFALTLESLKRFRIGFSGYFLSFIPMFSVLSITSIAFINKLIVFFLYVFLSRRFEENKLILFFMIPSLILYSSVALRDPIAMVFGVISLIYLIEKRVFLSLIFSFFVLLTKLQNAPAFFFVWVLFFVFKAHKSYMRLFLTVSGGILLFFIFYESISPTLNLYRLAWAVEDGLRISEAEGLRLESAQQLFSTLFYSFPRFMLEPLPWNINCPIQVIFFIETIILFILFFNLLYRDQFYKNKEGVIITLGLLSCMAVHAITVFNLGTMVRYRFIGFFPFLIALYYLRDLIILRKRFGTI